LLDVGVGPNGEGAAVVRCGRLGCCVGARVRGLQWIPALFGNDDQHRVVEVTGAGNAFMGGFGAGLHLNQGDFYEAALYGSVSASFVVEQVGPPQLDTSGPHEIWNGDEPRRRLQELRQKIASGAA